MIKNDYKLTLKKDWLFILLTTLIGGSVLLFLFMGLKIALDLDKDSIFAHNQEKIRMFNSHVLLVCTTNLGAFSNVISSYTDE
jgi:hypothetical protein